MSYLLDKKQKNKKILRWALIVCVLLIMFYFRSPFISSLSYVAHIVLTPFMAVGNVVSNSFGGFRAFVANKDDILKENEDLRNKLNEQTASLSNQTSVLADKLRLEAILGRKQDSNPFLLSAILAKPNKSPYDTLIVDTGENNGVKTGDLVFAMGNVPIGRVAAVYPFSAKIVLFSTADEKTEVVLATGSMPTGEAGQSAFVEVVGRGGGNFEMVLPRDFSITEGTEVVLPGIHSYTVAVVQAVISDPRDAFSKALLISPINIYELKFVQIKI